MSFNIPIQTLGEVFQNQYPFQVPKYQRGYAWDLEEVNDLLKDIVGLQSAQGSKISHFMGGLVHVHLQAANAVSRIHEVVDGQQRMATFSLLMAAIVEGITRLKEEAKGSVLQSCDSRKEEIEEAYLFYKETVQGKRVYRPKLVMSKVDAQFFADVIDKVEVKPERETHRRIQQAYKCFLGGLIDPIVLETSKTVGVRLKNLVALAKLVADNFVVIHIVSQSRKEAYRLFSVLNDRGRNLSDGDLLRARTLELTESDHKVQSQIEVMWDRILDGSEDEIEKFLRAYYPSTLGRRAPSNALFDAYEEGYLKGKSTNEILDFVKKLDKEKPFFDDISAGLWPFKAAQSIATNWNHDRLGRLVNVLRHEAAHPLLLAAVGLGEKKFIEILSFLERFVFRYINITGAHVGPIYVPYYSESVEMRKLDGAYSTDSLRQKLKSLIEKRAPDQQFQDALGARLQYSDDSARNRLIKHFLTTIETYHASADQGKVGKNLKPNMMLVFDLASTTLEHIYPQKATTSAHDAALEGLKSRLGNLTVLSATDNSQIGNVDFLAKKVLFSKSTVTLNQEISKLTAWTEKSLELREKRLFDLALKVFGI